MENVVSFIDRKSLNEEASEWLIKLDGDRPPSQKDLDDLREWINRSPQHRDSLIKLAAMWDNLNVLMELAVPLDKPVRKKLEGSWLKLPRRTFAMTGLAAVFVLGLVVLMSTWLLPSTIDHTNGRYATAVGQQRQFTLADGSNLQLNTNSEIMVTYGEDFRDIYLLQGEAHFEVARNKEKPFRVFANQGLVQAIGTAFSVYLKDRGVNVTVTDGRVSLAALQDSVPIPIETSQGFKRAPGNTPSEVLGTLAAGQGATIRSAQIDEELVGAEPQLSDIKIFTEADLNRRLSWRRGLLIFAGEPLEQVVEEINRYTTVTIDIPDEAVRAIKVGGQFEVGDTEKMLAALEMTFALRVERGDNNRVKILSGSKEE